MTVQPEREGRVRMEGWTEGIRNALEYIEDNITGELDIEAIAARAYVSPFHFQRIFSVLCGFTVGEYIRLRRLTLAAQELSGSDIKVIDAAVRYGYDSPTALPEHSPVSTEYLPRLQSRRVQSLKPLRL